MSSTTTDWLPGIIAIAVGALAAISYLLFGKTAAVPASQTDAAPDDAGTDLEERYRSLINQLKEHQQSKHLAAPDAWAAEQARLELLAAQALRQRDGKRHEAEKTKARADKLKAQQAAATGPLANPLIKGALIGGAIVAFFVVVGLTLSQQSTPRDGSRQMPGAMGQSGSDGPTAPQAEDPRLAQMRAQVQRNPDDVDLVAKVAGEYMRRRMYEDAVPLVLSGSALDPFHPRLRVQRLVLELVSGAREPQATLAELERLGDWYDDTYEAHLYAGLLAMELSQQQRALTQLERYLQKAPADQQPPMIRQSVAMLKQQLNGLKQQLNGLKQQPDSQKGPPP